MLLGDDALRLLLSNDDFRGMGKDLSFSLSSFSLSL